MEIDKKIKSKLLYFDDKEDIYEQFEKKCAYISRKFNIVIHPSDYRLQYNAYKGLTNYFADMQTSLYETISNKHNNIDFSIHGRFKSEYSHFEKIIRKFVQMIENDTIKPVQVFDDFAMTFLLLSVNYPIRKVGIDLNGIYIDPQDSLDEFRIARPIVLDAPYTKNTLVTDAFEFDYNGKLTVLVEEGQKNIFIEDNIPYIATTIDNQKIKLPLNLAKTYKKSSRDSLIPYNLLIQDNIEEFFIEKKFMPTKKKDYISNPKESGYSSIQCSFYSEESGLCLECQNRTYDMELYNKWERTIGYKPKETTLSRNALSKTPIYLQTTKFPTGVVQTNIMNEGECFELCYGIPLLDYHKKIQPNILKKEEETR